MTDLARRISELSPARRELLARLRREKGVPSAIGTIRRGQRPAGELPLSHAQQRLWFLDQMAPGGHTYNVFDSIALDGSITPAVIRRSLDEIVRRHEALRTTFGSRGGEPFQVIADHVEIELPVVDLHTRRAGERAAEAERVMAEVARRPFDLACGPLVRVTLLRDGDDTSLLVCMHHIVSDAWSLDIFEKELRALCASASAGRPAELPALPVQYADYAVWQREYLQNGELETQLAYWTSQLSGAPATLDLPTVRARPPEPSYRGATQWRRLHPALTDDVRTASRAEGVTPFMLTLAAFAVLLSRHADQTDIIVGTPVAGRTRAETEALIGFFVNTLVLRIDLSGDPTFHDVLQRVRATCVSAYAHQDVPFEMVVDALHPTRDLSRNPLFQVSFQFSGTQATPGAAPETESDDATEVPVEHEPAIEEGAAKFDLSVHVWDEGATARVQADYSTDLFDDPMIGRLLEHFERVLRWVVAHREHPVSRLALTGPDERRTMLDDWNATATPFPRDDRLDALVARRAAEAPDACAVIAPGERISYAELDERAERLAAALRARGVTNEVPVGLLMDRSVAIVVGMLGILKAGGTYVPLDPEYPAERLAFMIHDSRIGVVVTERRFVHVVPGVDVAIVLLDEVTGGEVEPGAAARPAHLTGGDSLAYIIYTSGSTGTPKGVAVTHRGIARTVCGTSHLSIDRTDRVMMASNPSFDAATFEVWSALVHGATLVVVPRDRMLAPERLADEVRTSGISVMFLTTALLNQVAAARPDAFAGVRCVLFGGEAPDPGSVRKVLRAGPPARLLHMYGPTESTTFASWHLVDDVPDGALTIPIGGPVSNTRLYVLDRHLEPVPVGVPGEIHVGGDGLARGYWHRPGLTADRFVPDPFGREPGGRLYRTGDIGRYLQGGAIEFVGRRDQQVKIRGYRVELGEIEVMLRDHPAVQDVVVVCADLHGDKRLVAYVAPRAGRRVADADLRTFMQGRAPGYLVPSMFVTIDEVPLTPNGKVDRRALPAPEDARLAAGGSRTPPQTPTEQSIARIFGTVLRADGIGRDDSFFDLGGHSLLATQIVARVREALHVDVPLRTLFTSPTVAGFASAVDEAATHRLSPAASSILAVDRTRFRATRTAGGVIEIPDALRAMIRGGARP